MARRSDKGPSRHGGRGGDQLPDRNSDRPTDRTPDRTPDRGGRGVRSGGSRPSRRSDQGADYQSGYQGAADRHPPEQRPRPRPGDDLIRVAGLPSVSELFETAAGRVERLYFEAQHKAVAQAWCAELGRRHKVYRQLKPDEMQRVAGTAMHGGIVALARPRPIRPFEIEAAERWAQEGSPLLILDGVGNPQNIGAIARTAAFYGLRRLVISDHPGQSGISDASYRIAKGGLEWLDLYRAERLPEVLRRLAGSYQIVATAVERASAPDRLERIGKPVALVLGNEEEGLPRATLAACPYVVALSGSGNVQSLNVSAAAAILIHTLLGRR